MEGDSCDLTGVQGAWQPGPAGAPARDEAVAQLQTGKRRRLGMRWGRPVLTLAFDGPACHACCVHEQAQR